MTHGTLYDGQRPLTTSNQAFKWKITTTRRFTYPSENQYDETRILSRKSTLFGRLRHQHAVESTLNRRYMALYQPQTPLDEPMNSIEEVRTSGGSVAGNGLNSSQSNASKVANMANKRLTDVEQETSNKQQATSNMEPRYTPTTVSLRPSSCRV